MCDLNILTFEFAQQFNIMIAGYAECCSRYDHAHYQPKHCWDVWSTIHQIAYKDSCSTHWGIDGVAVSYLITKFVQQCAKLIVATVNIANDIERPVFAFQVVPQRFTRE